ncbi:MAG: hypothetical protein PHC98_08175 [Syntrophotalea acetylenica]|nr:hypothetical protein [Syntrophotalea acetylenica]
MLANHTILIRCLLIVTFILGMGGPLAWGASVMSENKVPGQVESKARRLMQDLKKEGFEVSRGYFKIWAVEDCQYTFAKMGTCYGNNPAAPYVVATLPAWPEEFVDPVYSNIWGLSHPGYHDVYRFDPHEALVILGHLPPPGAYFSEQTWLFTREGTYDENDSRYQEIKEEVGDFVHVFFQQVPSADPERYVAFSSLSNIVNNVVIERQSGSAFDQIRYFIITPDQFMDEAVRKSLRNISVAKKDVFTEPIPSDINIGLDWSADNFTTWLRYAHPEDTTLADAWREDLPLVVLRIRDPRSNRRPETYRPVEFEERSAVDEYPLEPDLEDLLDAVAQRWVNEGYEAPDPAESFNDLQTAPIWLRGPLCNEHNQDCLGDNWDAAYQLLLPKSLDNGEIYAVAGTLGTETGNATYVGLSINQMSHFKGVMNIPDEKLKGTADGYSAAVNNTDKLFLVYFTRDCSGLQDITDDHCVELPITMIPEGDSIVVGVRDYIKPDTQRAPDSALVLPSRALRLQRPD